MQPFTIGEAEKGEIARTLKLERPPSEIDGAIAHVIAVYKATATGSSDTTIGNTLAALRELEGTEKNTKELWHDFSMIAAALTM